MKKKTKLLILSLATLTILGTFLYFFSFVSRHSYLGVKLDDARIVRIFTAGLAEKLDIKVGDKVLLINQKPIEQNPVQQRWEIIEQVQNLTLERGGEVKSLIIPQTSNIVRPYLYLTLLALLFYGLFIIFLFQKELFRSSLYFLFFSFILSLTILADIPAGMGNNFARLILMFFLTIMPVFIHYFAFHLSLSQQSARSRARLKLVQGLLLALSLFVTILSFLYIFYRPSDFFVSYFLPSLYYYLLLSIVVMTLCYSWGKLRKKNSPLTRLNLPAIILLSFLPFTFSYLFPTPWEAPFSIVIPFMLLPLLCILYLFILSRLIRYEGWQFRLVSTLFFSFSVLFISFLDEFLPRSVIIAYSLLLFYFLFPLIEELSLLVNKKSGKQAKIDLFLAMEREREDIALLLHDSLLQKQIHSLREFERRQKPINQQEVLNLLADNIYELRHICSNLQPLLLKENGLKRSLEAKLKQLQEEYPVEINLSLNKGEPLLSEGLDTFIFRSLIEMVHNAIKHGKASNIHIKICEEAEQTRFEVWDN